MDEREARIRELLPLVRRIAVRMHALIGGTETDDLFGDGCVGLIRAVDAYDPARGTTLIAYARTVIAGAMLNGVRRMDPVSERTRRTIRAADTLRFAVAGTRGTLPSERELEDRFPGLRAARANAHRQAPISLDAPLPAGEALPADWAHTPAALALRRERQRELQQAIARLSERQQHIVRRHYFGAISLHALGRELNVSPQRVSQLHLGALKKLRAVCAAL